MATPFKFEMKKFGAFGAELFEDLSECFYEESRFAAMDQQDMARIEIMENRDVEIRFTSEHDARLYMDTLDYWQSGICKEDDYGDVYIEPAEEPITFFKNSSHAEKLGYYPFIPGTYRIHITCQGMRYFSYLHVQAKQVTNQELDTMRIEVEEMIENLAKQRIHSGLANKKEFTNDLLNQILILGQNARKLIGAMDQIRHAPRSRIEKNYLLKKTGQPGEIDRETIKYRLRHPHQSDVLLLPERSISRNLPENQAMIQAVHHILKVSRSALTFLDDVNDIAYPEATITLNAEYDYTRKIQSYLPGIKKIANACVLFLNEGWVKEVHVPAFYTNGLHIDPRYRSVSKLSRMLKKTSRKLRLNEGYSYTWQRTDKLYEMWCFIKLVHALQSDRLKFTPSKGWIYDDFELQKSYHVPLLSEGTAIEFAKDEHLRIRLVYDGLIESEMRKTSFEEPLYTEFPQNRPDARLDIYIKDVYEGSIVMDFKYRPAYVIGTLKNYYSASHAYKQLLHYSKLDSAYTGKGQADVRVLKKTRRAPVAEVWVMYPGPETGLREVECVNDWLMKIPYRPTDRLEKLESLLLNAIENITHD